MEISDGDDKLFASCLLPFLNIGMTVAVSSQLLECF